MYNPYLPTNYFQPQTQAQSPIIWVQGEAAAKSYYVAPNNTVQLWDSEAQTIYVKTADASGMPSLKILDYTIRGADTAVTSQEGSYATKEDLEVLRATVEDLRAEIDGLSIRRPTRKKEAVDDE